MQDNEDWTHIQTAGGRRMNSVTYFEWFIGRESKWQSVKEAGNRRTETP